MKNVTALTAKLVRADEKQYANLTKEGRDLGAVTQDFNEHRAFFQTVPDFVPGIGGKSTAALGAYTRLNNKLVWAVDTAAKQEYAKLLVRKGEAQGLEAGGLASSRLVDYANVSPMVKALRYVAPFGTFRGSVPQAVLGGVARNPARAALLNRASGGTMYGGKPDRRQHGTELYNPTADVTRGVDDPFGYVRATLGDPVKAGVTTGLAEPLAGVG